VILFPQALIDQVHTESLVMDVLPYAGTMTLPSNKPVQVLKAALTVLL
jgi:hypothetical protein